MTPVFVLCPFCGNDRYHIGMDAENELIIYMCTRCNTINSITIELGDPKPSAIVIDRRAEQARWVEEYERFLWGQNQQKGDSR